MNALSHKRVILVMLVLIMISPNSYADIIPSGHHSIEHCFEIANTNEYPNHTFLAKTLVVTIADSSWISEVIKGNDCIKFHRGVKKLQICATSRESNTKGMAAEESSNPICSNILDMKFAGIVHKSDPTQKVIDSFSIEDTNDDRLSIKETKVTYIYKDGSVEELPYTTQAERPVATRAYSSLSGKFWFILPLSALVAIFLIVMWKLLRRER
ncbi:hypothetical protein CMI38_04870 [Candidatus Pacearchaeota archaeon]|nr:hypothetical protein [Candidatus Pacearchaeota archaeon]